MSTKSLTLLSCHPWCRLFDTPGISYLPFHPFPSLSYTCYSHNIFVLSEKKSCTCSMLSPSELLSILPGHTLDCFNHPSLFRWQRRYTHDVDDNINNITIPFLHAMSLTTYMMRISVALEFLGSRRYYPWLASCDVSNQIRPSRIGGIRRSTCERRTKQQGIIKIYFFLGKKPRSNPCISTAMEK